VHEASGSGVYAPSAVPSVLCPKGLSMIHKQILKCSVQNCTFTCEINSSPLGFYTPSAIGTRLRHRQLVTWTDTSSFESY
jgi:hypothetical protein